ncbi:hypothetical protein H9P43_004729 [Blastocladiella emersonii ATCC 22665]|nr:hypothetical protein H9P43_004729 [Blastocladiella emersonii ATCC 22665]
MVALLARSAAAAQLRYVVAMPTTSTADGAGARAILDVLTLAVDDINKQVAGPAGHNVTLMAMDTGDGNSLSRSVKTVFDAASPSTNAAAVIGDFYSGSSMAMALAASNLGLYQCSGAATSIGLSDKRNYPTFFRTIPADDQQGVLLAKFVRSMGWRTCNVLASNSAYGRSIAESFVATAEGIDLDVPVVQVLNFGASLITDMPIDAVQNSGSRVVVFLGEQFELMQLLAPAAAAGIIGDEWVWLASEGVAPILDMAEAKAPNIRRALQGLLYAFPNENAGNAEAQALQTWYKAAYRRDALPPYAVFFRDCLHALTAGFVAQLKSGASEQAVLGRTNLAPLNKFLTSFSGPSGKVAFNEKGDRIADYTIFNVVDGKATPVYKVAGDGGSVTALAAKPTFYSGSSSVPQDRPDALLAYLRFSGGFGGWVVAAVTGLAVLAIAASLVMLAGVRHTPIVHQNNLVALSLKGLGIMLVLGSTVLWIDEQTDLKCNAYLWSVSIGFELIVVTMLYQTFYVWKWFENSVMLRNKTTTAVSRALPFVGLALVEVVLLGAWTAVAPLHATNVSTATSFSFKCVSRNETTGRVFQAVHLAWNAVLLFALLYLARAARRLPAAANAPRFTLYVAQNILFSCLVLSPLAIVAFPGFAMGSYWIHLAVVTYACAFAWTLTHLRVLQAARRPEDRDGEYRHTAMKPGVSGTGATASTVSADLAAISGKPGSVTGDFPVKVPGRLTSTWQLHRIVLALNEGYLGVLRIGGDTHIGDVWALKHLLLVPAKDLDLCVEVHVAGKVALLIQMRSEEQRQRFLAMCASRRHIPAPNEALNLNLGHGTNAHAVRLEQRAVRVALAVRVAWTQQSVLNNKGAHAGLPQQHFEARKPLVELTDLRVLNQPAYGVDGRPRHPLAGVVARQPEAVAADLADLHGALLRRMREQLRPGEAAYVHVAACRVRAVPVLEVRVTKRQWLLRSKTSAPDEIRPAATASC